MNMNNMIETFTKESGNIVLFSAGLIFLLILLLLFCFRKKKNSRFYPILVGGMLLVLLIGSLFGSAIVLDKTNYGLDLQGGFEVLYQIHSLNGENVTKDMVTSTYKTISKRINVLGVSEPEITIEGEDRIRIRLAGITDPDQARETLSTTASLTFRDAYDNLLMTSEVLGSSAKLTYDNNGLPAVLLSIKDTEKFYEVTNKVKDMTNNLIVIWLDFNEEEDSYQKEKDTCGSLEKSKCLSAATVYEAFSSDVIIQGNFTAEEARSLVELINSGALPTSLEELSSRTVEASFGENSLNKTLFAGVLGLTIVILLMIFLYHVSGFVASVCIMIYTCLSFLLFYLIGGVLTLPGIAAMILGIGMAVDASVISFERMKEYLKEGKDLKTAFKEGNKTSLSSIVDANVTTFIVAIILFIFGESSIKGFATMLMINIIVTVFVMVFLNRAFLSLLVETHYFDNRFPLFIRFSQKESKFHKKITKLHFVKYRKLVLGMTACFLALILGISLWKGFSFGVDFVGGSNITITKSEEINLLDIQNAIEEKYTIKKQEETDEYTSILIQETLTKEEENLLKENLQENYQAQTEIFVVSQIVRQELVKNGLYSLALALLGIIIYVSVRFHFHYAVSGIIALIYDSLVVIGLFGLFGLEISSIFIAAILTIIGYSINDTIVTFDRLRENYQALSSQKKKNAKITEKELETIVDTSIHQTLYRTLLTTFTTLIPVLCLMILGAYEIIYFNIALFIGFIAGVYSSIYISNQIWYILEVRNLHKKPKEKKDNSFDEPEELLIKGINS